MFVVNNLTIIAVVVFCTVVVCSDEELIGNEGLLMARNLLKSQMCPGCGPQNVTRSGEAPMLCGVRICNCSSGADVDLRLSEARSANTNENRGYYTSISTPTVYCRDTDLLALRWNVVGNTFYNIEYSSSFGRRHTTNLTRCGQEILMNLDSGIPYRVELYSITIMENGDIELGKSRPLTVWTRQRDERPNPVRNLTLSSWTLSGGSYIANLKFVKAFDRACYYEIHAMGSHEDDDYYVHEITDPLAPQELGIPNLGFDREYSIAILAYANNDDLRLESEKFWLNITVPSCLQTYPGSSLCTPEQPQNFTVEEQLTKYNLETRTHLFNITLYWSEPSFKPEYYSASLHFMNQDDDMIYQNISGDSTSATFENVKLGAEYQAFLVAYSLSGPSHPAVIHRHINGSFIPIPDEQQSLTLELVIMLIICPIIVVGIILMVAVNHYLSKRVREKHMHKYFKELEQEKVPSSVITSISTISGDLDHPVDKWEVDPDKLIIKAILGEGEFGVVRKGWITKENQETEVAIKMLRDYPSSEEMKQFFQEMEIMKSVPAHTHLVSLIGCVTKGKPMLVVEYCSKGDLQTYLRTAWKKITTAFMCKNKQDSESQNDICAFNKLYDFSECELEDIPQPKDLISFARQICIGMEYLSSLKLIHRDLAARNVLVHDNKTVKISDFGLSRDVYYDNIYCKQSGGKLPIRWMALESMTHQLYTTQSDVWSFGILLWEIVTMGGTPYPGVVTSDLLGMLKQGYRMERPPNCSDELYAIMLSCWKTNPKERPTFTELRQLFDGLLEQVSQYLTLEFMTANEFVPLNEVNSHHNKSYFQEDRYMKPLM